MICSQRTLDERAKISSAVRFVEEKNNESTRFFYESLLKIPPLEMVVQLGPYCPKKCDHCYGNYGPNRKGQLSPEILTMLMKQLPETDVFRIILTDGEPFHNLSGLLKMLDVLDGFPTVLFTNGSFAVDYDDAVDVLKEIRKHGFSVKSQPNRTLQDLNAYSQICVSADNWHGPDSFENALTLFQAYNEVFYDELNFYNVKQCFNIQYTRDENSKNYSIEGDNNFKKKLLEPLFDLFQNPGVYCVHNNKECYIKLKYNMGFVKVDIKPLGFIGRARDFFCHEMKVLTSDDIHFNYDIVPLLGMFSDGNVFDSLNYCANAGRHIGSIRDSTLGQMINSRMHDPIYQMFRIGGVRALFNFLKIIGLADTFIGYNKCSVCEQIFSDTSMVDELRTQISKELTPDNDIIKLVYNL